MPSGLETSQGALADTVTNIKSSGGQLHFVIGDSTSAKAWVQLFDLLAADVTLGTTAPKLALPVPDSDVSPFHAVPYIFPVPVHFKTAISAAFTTTATGNTAAVAGRVNFGFL